MSVDLLPALRPARSPWNKGRIIGQRHPLLPRHVWSIRVRLEMAGNARDLALFNMAVDSKLRGCDLVALRVRDVFAGGRVKERTSMIQSKTGIRRWTAPCATSVSTSRMPCRSRRGSTFDQPSRPAHHAPVGPKRFFIVGRTSFGFGPADRRTLFVRLCLQLRQEQTHQRR